MVEFDFSVKEEEDYSQGVPSIKEIALMHIRKISNICCSEFTKSYWDEKPIKVGSGIAVMRTYHPDQRAVFCNAVDFLRWIVLPYSDDTFKTSYKSFDDDKEESWEEKMKSRIKMFKDINLMFEKKNFFDSLAGKGEKSK